MSVVAVNFASDSFEYVSRLLELGAVVGTPPTLTINPSIRPLVDALYEVLAGGSVAVTAPGVLTIKSGVPQTVIDLRQMEADCTASINTINARAGFSFVIEF